MNSNSVRLDDDSLEKVSGGYFGPTEHVIKVTAANYNTVINSAPTAFISFGAFWAGPCTMLSDVLEQLGSETQGTAVVGVVDVDDEPDLCKKLGIIYVPTTIKYKNGAEVQREVGYHPIDTWRKMI